MSEAEHAQADGPGEPAEPQEQDDDVKRKFREALDRKQAQRHRAEQSAANSGKAATSHGPVGGKRSFRRKSG
jgi:hypothetical protein